MAFDQQLNVWQRTKAALVGLVLITIGLAGLVLPILPGWILIFAGMAFLASAIPALRSLASRLVMSEPANRIVKSAARSATGRRLIGLAMRLQTLRRGLTPSARWHIVRSMLRQVTDGPDERESP